MSDNEIIKALECCGNQMYFCTDKDCKAKTLGNALDLINRQKAEIERLTRENIALNRTAIPSSGTILKVGNALLFAENKEDYDITINTIKAEAYKEFAERLKDKRVFLEDDERYLGYAVKEEDIDDTLKELMEKGS